MTYSTQAYYVIPALTAFVELMLLALFGGVLLYLVVVMIGILVVFVPYFAFHNTRPRPAADVFAERFGIVRFAGEYKAREFLAFVGTYSFAVTYFFRPLLEHSQSEIVRSIASTDEFSILLLNTALISVCVGALAGYRAIMLRLDPMFEYFRTLSYLSMAAQTADEERRTRLFERALKCYNSYLNRRIHLRILALSNIALKFRMADVSYRNDLISRAITELEVEEEPGRRGLRLISLLSSELGHTKIDESLSTDKSLRSEILVILGIIASIVSGALPLVKDFISNIP